MTPERALAERVKTVVDACHHTSFAKVDPADRHGACDACIAAFAAEYAREQVRLREDYWTGEIQKFCDPANGSEAKLAAAHQREEHWHAHFDAMVVVVKQAQAEVDRLTLAASESARTLQVRIAELKAGERHCDEYHGELADQVTALREALVRQMGTHNMVNTRTRDLCACEACRMAQQALAALPQDGA